MTFNSVKSKKFLLGWLFFTLIAGITGALWHTYWFSEEYAKYNFITANEVIISLALVSMLLFGFISTYFFHQISKLKNLNYINSIATAFIIVLIPRMSISFAHAAEQDVNGKVFELILFEFGLYSIIALLWGVSIAKIYKHIN